jgi:hypothetical protein
MIVGFVEEIIGGGEWREVGVETVGISGNVLILEYLGKGKRHEAEEVVSRKNRKQNLWCVIYLPGKSCCVYTPPHLSSHEYDCGWDSFALIVFSFFEKSFSEESKAEIRAVFTI